MTFVDSKVEASRTLRLPLFRLALIVQLIIGLALSVAARSLLIRSPLATDIRSRPIRFQLFGNLAYVPVRVNDAGPFSFILDSGAQSSVIDERLAKALGLKVRGQANVIGIGESVVKVGVAKYVSLTFGEAKFANQDLVVYPCADLEHTTGHVIDGILGAVVFKRFIVEIDYSSPTVILHDSQTSAYEGPGDTLPLTIEGGLPFIRGRISLTGRSALEAKILIDTGANTALVLNRPFVEAHKVIDSITQTIESPDMGTSGEANGRLGRVPGLQLGRFVIDNPITGFSRSMKGALAATSNDGLVGGAVLRRFKVLLDYYHRRLILEPNVHFGEAYETEMSGALLTVEGKNLNTFRIKRAIENSPAMKAGLLSGDVIISIDSRPTSELDLEQVNEIFKQRGQTILLSVKRGDRVLRVQLELRRLI